MVVAVGTALPSATRQGRGGCVALAWLRVRAWRAHTKPSEMVPAWMSRLEQREVVAAQGILG